VIAAATERIERAERHAAETLAKVEFAKRELGGVVAYVPRLGC